MSKVSNRGFTLIELITALALVAILAVLAIPSFRGFIANQQVKTASYDLLVALNYARGEAIKRNETVTVQAVGGAWSGGWQVKATIDGTAVVLKEWDAQNTISFSDTPVSFAFLANGRISGGVGASLSVCKRKATQRIVIVDMSGHASLKRSGACSE
ncbi:GspH/FimT family pseudopilin [Pseudomonas sp. BN411]|uniref:GspH/FimT family pseudopilin n=1 Tax=Pseudomonas sp. BN411 TaxID=2567887 RepID=UPI0024586DFB|nr:GspH/FimT family pseudopilin [Pseudomonas sp. BN411]MDH4561489.1 prepilin-type N-terminal cleavage/methylation domain-containing protein [Pseudomonas sp. BN411]